jgi:hypothetical protein
MQSQAQLVADGLGGAIIVWTSYEGSTEFDIFARRINSTGALLWGDRVPICNLSLFQTAPQICSDDAGGGIIVWTHEAPSGDFDIRGQRIALTGVPQWQLNGIVITNASDDQRDPQICPDGAGGAIITWEDDRFSSAARDIYAQRINASGLAYEAANGTIISNAADVQQDPVLAPIGDGGVIIAWSDLGTDPDGDVFAAGFNIAPEGNGDGNGGGIPGFSSLLVLCLLLPLAYLYYRKRTTY